jgi:non-heme chloroperoxidase
MANLRFSTVRLKTGPLIHYAEQGDADGAPILFLHGWPDSWFSFSRILPLLSRRIRAVVPDQRGFGASERPDGDYSIETFAADALALLDALSIKRAAVVGHSFGTFVARGAAIAGPQRVSRMVLIGSGYSGANQVTREVQAGLRDLSDPVPIEFARDFQASTAFAPLPEAFFERLVVESLKLPARLWRAVFDGIIAYDDTARLGQIRTPTLIVWGEQDGLFPRTDQDRLLSAIPGSRLIVYPETGHCPNWERPERVAADLDTFLGVGPG